MTETRRNKSIRLVGQENNDISGSKLPSNKQVLQYFFYQHRTLRKSIRESARSTVRKCKKIWEKANIPTTQEINSIAKLERLYKEWKYLGKSKNKKNCIKDVKEFKFREKLDCQFIMSSNNSSNKKMVYGKLCSQQLERQNIKDSLLADIESEVESEHESVDMYKYKYLYLLEK